MQAYVDEGLAEPYDTEMVARAIVPMAIAMLLYAKRTTPEKVDDAVNTIAAMLDGGIMRLTSWKKAENRVRSVK